MTMIDLKERGPHLNLPMIESFERSLGRKLPEEYRGFLLDTNGGRPELNHLRTENRNVSCGVVRFYSILDRAQPNDLLAEQASLKSRIPSDFLVIADCEGGNRLCISLRAEDFGFVFFWDHELYTKSDPPAALFLVARDFSAFFNALSKLDPASIDLNPDQIDEAWIDPAFLDEVDKGE